MHTERATLTARINDIRTTLDLMTRRPDDTKDAQYWQTRATLLEERQALSDQRAALDTPPAMPTANSTNNVPVSYEPTALPFCTLASHKACRYELATLLAEENALAVQLLNCQDSLAALRASHSIRSLQSNVVNVLVGTKDRMDRRMATKVSDIFARMGKTVRVRQDGQFFVVEEYDVPNN